MCVCSSLPVLQRAYEYHSCKQVPVSCVYMFGWVQVYLLSKEEGGKGKPTTNYMQAQMYLKTWDAPAFVLLPSGKDMVMPGEDARIEFLLRKPMV